MRKYDIEQDQKYDTEYGLLPTFGAYYLFAELTESYNVQKIQLVMSSKRTLSPESGQQPPNFVVYAREREKNGAALQLGARPRSFVQGATVKSGIFRNSIFLCIAIEAQILRSRFKCLT